MDYPFAYHILFFSFASFLSCSPELKYSPEAIKARFSVRKGQKTFFADKSTNFAIPTAWPNASVPYVLSDTLKDVEKEFIHTVLDQLRNKTCLNFTSREKENSYVWFTSGPSCAANVGMQGGKQFILLEGSCYTKTRLARQLLHVLGLHSDLNRPDRDNFVDINWGNIKLGKSRGFLKYPSAVYLNKTLEIPFDYQSASHFEGTGYAVDPVIWTIRSKSGKNLTVESDQGFSEMDITKIKQVYCTSPSKTVIL